MDSKLTLRLDKEIIDKAKAYASSSNTSLSLIIESYLKTLVARHTEPSDSTIEISPFVSSMKTGVRIPSDINNKNNYLDHLEEKHR